MSKILFLGGVFQNVEATKRCGLHGLKPMPRHTRGSCNFFDPAHFLLQYQEHLEVDKGEEGGVEQ